MTEIALNTWFLDPAAKVINSFSMSDVYYQILQESGDQDCNNDITIVDMSDLYNRRDLARLLNEIEEQTPRIVGVDIEFEGTKEDSIGDMMIWDVAGMYDNIVFSYRLVNYKDDKIGYADVVHSFFAEPLEVEEGFTNMQRDLYSSIKRVISIGKRVQGELRASFITKVANMYLRGESVSIEDREMTINFTPTHFTVVPSDSVKYRPTKLKDKIVLLGAMKEETDMHYTPLGKLAGVELLAYSIQTLLEHKEVYKLPLWVVTVVSFLLTLLTQVGWTYYTNFSENRKNKLVRLCLSNSFTKAMLFFLWVSFIVWLNFIIFFKYDVDIRIGLVLAGIAFLGLSRNFINECINTLREG
jgi:CHASE2 domain-containing sensor protein